MNLPEGTLTS
jgi:hypothetical protein